MNDGFFIIALTDEPAFNLQILHYLHLRKRSKAILLPLLTSLSGSVRILKCSAIFEKLTHR